MFINLGSGKPNWTRFLLNFFPSKLINIIVNNINIIKTEKYNKPIMFTSICYVKGLPWWLKMVKNPPAVQEMRVQSLGQEDPLEKGMTTHSSVLAWEIPWTEEPGRLQSMGLQRVRHHREPNTFFFLTLCEKTLSHIPLTSWMLLNCSAGQELFIPFYRWGNWVVSLRSYHWSHRVRTLLSRLPDSPGTVLSPSHAYSPPINQKWCEKCSHSRSVEKLSCLMRWLLDYFKNSEQERTQKLYIHPLNNLLWFKTFIPHFCDKGQRSFLSSMDQLNGKSVIFLAKKLRPAMSDFRFL